MSAVGWQWAWWDDGAGSCRREMVIRKDRRGESVMCAHLTNQSSIPFFSSFTSLWVDDQYYRQTNRIVTPGTEHGRMGRERGSGNWLTWMCYTWRSDLDWLRTPRRTEWESHIQWTDEGRGGWVETKQTKRESIKGRRKGRKVTHSLLSTFIEQSNRVGLSVRNNWWMLHLNHSLLERTRKLFESND